MANTPKNPEPGKAQPQSQGNAASETKPQEPQAPAAMLRDEKIKLAASIAKSARKWGRDEQELFTAAVLARYGIAASLRAAIIGSLDFEGAVYNGSQFSQWVDGNPESKDADKKDRLSLGFPLRQREVRKEAIDQRLAALGIVPA